MDTSVVRSVLVCVCVCVGACEWKSEKKRKTEVEGVNKFSTKLGNVCVSKNEESGC